MSDNKPIDSYSMFANVQSYLGLPLSRDIDTADLVVLGIPYDLATTGRAGTRHGPQGVRLASGNLRWEEKRWPWTFNAMDRLNVVDYGDMEFAPGDSQSMIDTVANTVGGIHAKGKKALSIGGDHVVTRPLVRAIHQQRGPLALVHFDAHTDTYKESWEFDHGGMFYFAPQEGLIDPAHSIPVSYTHLTLPTTPYV